MVILTAEKATNINDKPFVPFNQDGFQDPPEAK